MKRAPSALWESPMCAQLPLQVLSQRLAVLEAHEELVEKADDDGVDAHAFGFRPFLELYAGFGANVNQLRVGRSSVHRCPSRFTFRVTACLVAFVAAFLTATGTPYSSC